MRAKSAPSRALESKPRLEALETRENPAVHYYGGNLLSSVEAQPVYYGSTWSSAPAAQATTDSFLKDLTNSAYMDALHQAGYGVGRGTASPGITDSINIAAGTMVTDASIQARLKSDIASGLLPAPDANRLYVLYVEPNVAVNLGNGQGTTQQGVLGYHGAFAGSNGAIIRYAVIAYPGGSVGNSSLGTLAVDQLTAVTSHELAEAVTDPDVNFGRLGWYDPQRGEIGDITESNPNALVRLDGYLVQEVANQSDQLLELSPPPVSPPPPPASNASTTTTLTAGAVRYYGWYATVSLTITVKPASGTAQPTGTVALIYNGQVLGTATLHLVNGVETATFNVTFYSNGVYSFSGQYGGDGKFTGSTSNAKSVVV